MLSQLSDLAEAYSVFDSENNGGLMTGRLLCALLSAMCLHLTYTQVLNHCLYLHVALTNQHVSEFDVFFIIFPNQLDYKIFLSVAFFMLLILIDKFLQ